jgi:hypothetical protein
MVGFLRSRKRKEVHNMLYTILVILVILIVLGFVFGRGR